MRYLSTEWIDAAGRALAADEALADALAGIHLSLDQVVEDGPDGTVTWHVTIDDGRVSLAAGPAPAADVRFTTDYETAGRVAAGTLAAQRAFAEGRLRVGGDLSLLVAHHRAMSAVDDALAEVRAHTTYH